MSRIKIAKTLVKVATAAVKLKHRSMQRELRRAVSKALFIKQFEETEIDLAKAVAPVIEDQVKSIANGLLGISGGKRKRGRIKSTASGLIQIVYHPEEWKDKLVDAALPVLAVAMAEASTSYLLSIGYDVRKSSTKATTASRWLNEHPEDVEKLEEMLAESDIPISVFTEMPQWMKRDIAVQLTESFKQPYWDKISQTTGGDAERYLRKGLEDGWSIRRIATQMSHSFQGETHKYAMMRATNIARTESGNALNGARKASMDHLAEELPDIPMRPTWHSVLSDATRDDHANLDGVPADADGMWNLGGYTIPWPGHYTLPAGQRCNCMCTITEEFGMQDDEARRLIEEHQERVGGEGVVTELEKPVEMTYAERAVEWGKGLSDVESRAIQDYTDTDADIGYDEIRNCQNRNVGCSKEIRARMERMKEAFDRAPKYEGDVYRGLSFKSESEAQEFVARVQKNRGMVDKGFTSTSQERHIAQEFSTSFEERESDTGVMLKIKSKRGVFVGNVSAVQGEAEVILPPGSRLKLNKIKRSATGQYWLYVEEM